MSFKVVTEDAPKNVPSRSESVNWDKINEEKAKRQLAAIELLETQDAPEVINGYVVGYIDLGTQEREPYSEPYDEDNQEHKDKLDNGSFLEESYVHDIKKKVMCIKTPSKPAKAFTFAVDFPEYEQEWEFGGEVVKKPYRMYMGGSYWVSNPDSTEGKKMEIIQRPMYMNENTNNSVGKWALGVNSLPAKMGVAAGLADSDGLVTKEDITGILGKCFQFQVRVWNKPDKSDPKKTYFTENIKFLGKLGKKQTPPPFDEDSIFGVNFNSENDPDMLKQVRSICKNSMKLATNWGDSIIKKEIDKAKAEWKANKDAQASSGDNTGSKADKVSKPTPTKKETSPEPEIAFDDDIPF